MQDRWRLNRRGVLGGGLSAAALLAVSPALAALATTPRQSEGPFYPETLPLDRDNDLAQTKGHPRPAKGQIVHLSGRVLDAEGKPISGATIEIWQCDAFGVYRHPRAGGTVDPGFQGFGRTVAAADGGYRFRTIKPVPYPGRAPHIHAAVLVPGRPRLVTQLYNAGEAQNDSDWIFKSAGTARTSLEVAYAPAPDSLERGAFVGRFDFVLG